MRKLSREKRIKKLFTISKQRLTTKQRDRYTFKDGICYDENIDLYKEIGDLKGEKGFNLTTIMLILTSIAAFITGLCFTFGEVEGNGLRGEDVGVGP